jgi:heme/copper-type cytochrome/quinol oxidase subunit 1
MKTNKLIELSLHYDTMLWTVTAIFTAAIGGLLVYCTQKFNFWIACIGFFLTLITVYFAGSFRHLRRRIHAKLEEQKEGDVEYLYTKGLLRQWPAFQTIFTVLIISWLVLLCINEPNYQFYWYITGFFSEVLLLS